MAVDRRLLLATRNPGKLAELNGILGASGVVVIDLEAAGIPEREGESAIEGFDTLSENALAKARYFNIVSGFPAVADDSGLMVEALGGSPGVHSRRYSGRVDLAGMDLDDANNQKLMRELRDTLHPAAKFACAAAYVDGDVEFVEQGEAHGEITRSPRGLNGFGYDPYFLSFELDKTFGEATIDEKSQVSHRARAFNALVTVLRQRGCI